MILQEKDLMIGDIVMYNPNLFEDDEYIPPKPLEICVIRDHDDIGFAYEDGYTEVSLTAEILEKLGFYSLYEDKSAYKLKKKDDSGELVYCITIDFECHKTDTVRNKVDSRTYEGSITSLHQLQHILRDCGLSEVANGFFDKLKAGGLCTERHV